MRIEINRGHLNLVPVKRDSPDRQLVLLARVALLLVDECQVPSRNLGYLRALHRGRFRYGLSVHLKDAARVVYRDAVTADENAKGHRAIDRLGREGAFAALLRIIILTADGRAKVTEFRSAGAERRHIPIRRRYYRHGRREADGLDVRMPMSDRLARVDHVRDGGRYRRQIGHGMRTKKTSRQRDREGSYDCNDDGLFYATQQMRMHRAESIHPCSRRPSIVPFAELTKEFMERVIGFEPTTSCLAIVDRRFTP